jgi:UDP-N-acetyl-D-mannosaminuronate dehydrogenase
MPEYIMERVREELGGLSDRTIAILGVAYKGNVAETRNSPGLALAQTLETAPKRVEPLTDGGRGTVTVRLSDPHATDSFLDLHPLDEAIAGADAVVLTAAHDEYTELDPAIIADRIRSNLIFDAVNVLDDTAWESHGLRVIGI